MKYHLLYKIDYKVLSHQCLIVKNKYLDLKIHQASKRPFKAYRFKKIRLIVARIKTLVNEL